MKLYYYGARYYNANLGRFISPDPVRDGHNSYDYCYNNPISLFDPDGRNPFVIFINEAGSWVALHQHEIEVFVHAAVSVYEQKEEIGETLEEGYEKAYESVYDPFEDMMREWGYEMRSRYGYWYW